MDERRLMAEVDRVKETWYFQELIARIDKKKEYSKTTALSTDEEPRWRTHKGVYDGLTKVDAIIKEIDEELTGTKKFEPLVRLK